ncbi:hypothetical protein D3C87_2078720 [compost metagenome]
MAMTMKGRVEELWMTRLEKTMKKRKQTVMMKMKTNANRTLCSLLKKSKEESLSCLVSWV